MWMSSVSLSSRFSPNCNTLLPPTYSTLTWDSGVTMEDPNAESLNYIVPSKSQDGLRIDCDKLRVGGQVMLAQPEMPTETRDPSPSKALSRILTEDCLTPPSRMLAPSPMPKTKREMLVLPMPMSRDDSIALKEKYEVVGTKAPPTESEPPKKKLSKKRWSYLPFKKGENMNHEKASTTKGSQTARDVEVAAGWDESRPKKPQQPLRPRSRSRSRSRSRGRGTSPIKTVRKDPRVKPTSPVRRYVSPSPTRGRKPARRYDSSSVGPSINTTGSSPTKIRKNRASDERNDQSSRPSSRYTNSAEEKRIHWNDNTLSNELDGIIILPAHETPYNKEHAGTSTKPLALPTDRSNSMTSEADEDPEFGKAMQSNQHPMMAVPRESSTPTIGSPFCGSNNAGANPPIPFRNPVDPNHIVSMDQPTMEKVKPLSSNAMDDELLKPENIQIHNPDDFPAKIWNQGTIASLVRAANVRVDVMSVESSVAQSTNEPKTLPSPHQAQAAPSTQRFSGSTENIARTLGPFQSCLLKSDDTRKSTHSVKFLDQVLVESQSFKSSKKVAESVQPKPGNTAPTKPPVHPHRGRVNDLQRVVVDDNASVASFDTQGTQQSSASKNVSKSLKTAIKGFFSKKQAREKEQDVKQSEDAEVFDEPILLQNSDHRHYKEKKSIRKIESFVMESVDFLEEAANFIDKDAAEVEIYVAKAFAFANEAEKLATTLTSSAAVGGWDDEGMAIPSIRSVPSGSTCTSTNGTSFVHQLDRQERLRRLERLSFSDFGHSGIQSILCNGGGTLPIEQTRNLALETLQILETLSHTIHFSSQTEESIHSATSGHSKQQWMTYGVKGLATKSICGKQDVVAFDAVNPKKHKGTGLLPPRPHQVPLELDDSTIGRASKVVSDGDHSSFRTSWSPKRGNKKNSRKTMDDLSTSATDALNLSFSQTVSTEDHQGSYSHLNDNDTIYGSSTVGASVGGSLTGRGADSVSAASTTSLSVMKDILDLIAQEYCDRLCGGLPMDELGADDDFTTTTGGASRNDGESVDDMYFAEVARRERRRRGYL